MNSLPSPTRRRKVDAPTKGADVAGRPRQDTLNTNDPRGQFGQFLRAWIDRHDEGDEKKLAARLGMTDRAIRKWLQGSSGPAFSDLDQVARALGLADWIELALAVRRFHRSRN